MGTAAGCAGAPARGQMAPRTLIVFEHESKLGNAPAHSLFDRIKVQRQDQDAPARSFADYNVQIDRENLPSGITVNQIL